MVLVAVLLAAAAALLWQPRDPSSRLAALGVVVGPGPARRQTGHSPAEGRRARRPWWMSPWLSAAVAAFTVTRVVPGAPGYVLGLVAAGGVVVLLKGTASAAEARRRERLQADLPLAVDLLVSCVGAGRPPGQSLVTVATAVGGPVEEDLRAVAGRLELGADPMAVWTDLAADETFAPLGRCLARSARTGSSISVALARCADDLRRDSHAAADARARKVSVRASAPLGACFLPAFFLVGIVPTIIGSVRAISW